MHATLGMSFVRLIVQGAYVLCFSDVLVVVKDARVACDTVHVMRIFGGSDFAWTNKVVQLYCRNSTLPTFLLISPKGSNLVKLDRAIARRSARRRRKAIWHAEASSYGADASGR